MITKYALRFTALGYLTMLLLVPVGMIAWKAFENGWAPFWASVTDPDFLSALKLTLEIALIAVPLNTIFGIIIAIMLVRHNVPGKSLINAVLALPFALSLNRILNGVSRPLFGWLSDKFGREQTMFVAFAIEAAAFVLFAKYGVNPAAFVVLTGLIFLAYGEIYSLFPAICADSYGKKFASANAGLLYTAKGAASLIVPLSGIIAVDAIGWNRLFMVLAVMNLSAAILALVALKPIRARVK